MTTRRCKVQGARSTTRGSVPRILKNDQSLGTGRTPSASPKSRSLPYGPWLGEDDDQERFVRSQVVGCMTKHTVCHLPYLGESLSATVNATWGGRFDIQQTEAYRR